MVNVGSEIKGIICPAITPMKGSRIDDKAVGKLISFLKRSRVDGIFPAGSTGAFPFMDAKTHISVIRAFHEHMDQSMFFLPGTGRNSIKETIEVSRAAGKMGADAVVVVTPYYIKLDQNALAGYFSKIADSISGSMILYNIPQLTGNALGSDTIATLAKKHKNIIGIKDSSSDFSSFSDIVESVSGQISVFQGEDNLLLPSLEQGASGGVCGTTNFTSLAVAVRDAYLSDETQKAKALQKRLTGVMVKANTLLFPSNYNYLFYRTVMGKHETNAVQPLQSVGKEKGTNVFNNLQRILGKKL